MNRKRNQTSESSEAELFNIANTLPPVKSVNLFENTAQEKENHLINCPNDITLSESPILDRSVIQTTQLLSKNGEAINRDGLFLSSVEEIDSGTMMQTESIVDVSSDITDNTIWTSDNTYHVLAPIDVNGVMLVIEPGTTVTFAAGTSAGIRALNGGTILSRGIADNPILFTSDASTPAYNDYYCPLYIEETASPATKITYSIVEYAYAGVMLFNISLDTNVGNNYFVNCVYGILEYGPEHTDIFNNLCFGSYYSGIEVFMASYLGIEDANSVIHIENNTCDYYQDNGITVHGVTNSDNAGYVFLGNNIVSGSYVAGLNLVDGYMSASVLNTGYYDNVANKNWAFDEYNPVVVTSNPYETGTSGYAPICYLNQTCDFIDTGGAYIEQTRLIGMTTDANSVPDCNVVDIGFHYSGWDYSNVDTQFLESDFDTNGVTDVNDLVVIANYWLDTVAPNSNGDLDGDGTVNMSDFALLAGSWRETQDNPNIVPIISGDPDNGWIEVYANGFTLDTQDIFAFLDGRYVGKIPGLNINAPLDIDISESGNTLQQLKLIAIDCDGHITCSGLTDITYTSSLSYCILPQSYEPNEPIPFAAYNTDVGNATVEVYADGQQCVWSQTFTGNTITGSIPVNIAANYIIENVQFSSSSGASVSKTTSVSQSILSPPDPNVIALVVTPYRFLSMKDWATIKTVENAFENRGVKYLRLNGAAATYLNIAKYAPQLKYLYIDSHGNSAVQDGMNGVLRTLIALADVDCVSAKASDFIGTPPVWCKDPLPGRKEQTLKSFVTMGFTNLRFFYNDSCLGAHLTVDSGTGLLMWGGSGEQSLFDFVHNDMSVACGLTNTSQSRFYQGWFCESWSRIYPLETSFQQFSRNEWEALGEGEELYWALSEAIWQQDQYGHDDPAYNYRIKGQGDMQAFRIRSNP